MRSMKIANRQVQKSSSSAVSLLSMVPLFLYCELKLERYFCLCHHQVPGILISVKDTSCQQQRLQQQASNSIRPPA
jgi:hypothetical protein